MTIRTKAWLTAGAVALALIASHVDAQVPTVVLVQPSGPTVPANLLRVSIRFAAPPDGAVLGKLALLRHGSAIARPFLEQELWSADGRVLTVLMHPGRVKSGLVAREELGPILASGDEVMLVLGGTPLKRWQVTASDDSGPVASAWVLSPVSAGSSKPLTVTLDAPIDGRDGEFLAIADAHGRRVAGRGTLSSGERAWSFTPASPWRAGSYTLVVRGTLEDPAGNRLGGRFETTIRSRPGAPQDVTIPFSVGR